MLEKVSIIIPCYNDADFLDQSVKSAIQQNYKNKEIILVDDGSNERTKAVIENLRSQVNVVISQENKGVSAARNAGIKAALGKFILLLDSDDYFEPEFCEKAVQRLQEDEEVKVVTCYARWFRNSKDYQIFKPTGGDIRAFLFSNATLSNSMFRKEDWKNAGGYDEEMLKGFEDWEFFIRMHKDGGKTLVIPEVLFHYRKRERSKSTVANQNKYHLLEYIYLKHADLYKNNYSLFVEHLLSRIKGEEDEKMKNLNRKEFLIGLWLLKPLRWIKKSIKKSKR